MTGKKEHLMSSENWKTTYRNIKEKRPGINEIKLFLPDDIAILFEEFSNYLNHKYCINCKPPVYTEKDGWVYSYGRSSVIMLNRVLIEDNAFVIEDIRVHNKSDLQRAIKMIDRLYTEDFAKRFIYETSIKNEKQKQNTKNRLLRERAEIEAMSDIINKDRFNKFSWSPKLSRQKLAKLYKSDANGFQDEEMIDDVGYTLYARCLQGRDERLLIESKKIKCHNCKNILPASSALIQCQCGNQYLFREYMRSFRKEKMPSGSATKIFNDFIKNWSKAKGYIEKMLLIDRLIHEFHINLNSGVKGRFVAINLIQGTKKQIGDLIISLAYE
jgi:hypothetical protein